jgi:hypothetical protein
VATHRVTKAEGAWRGAFDVDREWGQVRHDTYCCLHLLPPWIGCRVAGTAPLLSVAIWARRPPLSPHGLPSHRIAEQVPVPLLPTTSGRGAVVGLWLGPEPHHRHARAVTLRLRLEQWTFVDRIEVWWDGHTLTTPAPPAATAAVGTIMTSHVQWLRFVLSGQQQQQQLALDEGIHRVEIILHHRNPQVLSEILLTDVEVLFDYGAPPTCGAAITAKL